jgi:2-C-methyl-D-erythritol 2,4-cyclodiphosphate synthase
MSSANRVGVGFDAHAFREGRKLVLGGVEIPHKAGLEGHSDADVLVHAVMDALLGAVGEREIGFHFPDTDERFKGISSMELLARVMEVVRGKGYRVVNLDCVVIAQEPRLSPYLEEIERRLAEATGVEGEAVAVKPTTTEGMGFTGRSEGIAAVAVVLVERVGS